MNNTGQNVMSPNAIKILSPRRKKFFASWRLVLLFLPCFLYFLFFKYVPMWGIVLSFQEYLPAKGVWGSQWVGFKQYATFLQDPRFWVLVRNTFLISFYSLIFAFPFTIIFALICNEVGRSSVKKAFQTISYMPHFISTVVIVGMLRSFLTPGSGMLSRLIVFLGGPNIDLLSYPDYFRTLYVATDIWQGTGWGAIIYFAAISNIDQELYESAYIDGANKLQQILHITIPCILPTIMTMFILRTGRLLSVGFEKAFLMQIPATYSTSDVISTYVYRTGMRNARFSYSSAVGIFNSLINLAFLISANYLSRKFSENSLW